MHSSSSLHPPGLDLREIEDVVDERQQGLGVGLDDVQIAPTVRGEPGALLAQQQVAVAHDRVERRADLVREVREELALEPGGLLELTRALLLDALGARELRRQPIEILVLLTDHLHVEGSLLVAGDGACCERALGLELLLELGVLRLEVGEAHASLPKTSAVSVLLTMNPQ